MEKKYILIEDYVFSLNDNDKHYINAPKLAVLYGINLRECLVFKTDQSLRAMNLGKKLGIPVLRPRSNGDYSLEIVSSLVSHNWR